MDAQEWEKEFKGNLPGGQIARELRVLIRGVEMRVVLRSDGKALGSLVAYPYQRLCLLIWNQWFFSRSWAAVT